ncbi:MAG: hypothetical protein ACK4LQ_12150 [Pararhodobacter sp.]
MPRTLLPMIALPFVLAGCLQSPAAFDRGPAVRPAPMAQPAPEAPGARPSAGAAENACVAAGQQQGLGVQGVVGTREVAGSDGQPTSRDVMLRVARGQQLYEVRCSYNYASAQARIMSL